MEGGERENIHGFEIPFKNLCRYVRGPSNMLKVRRQSPARIGDQGTTHNYKVKRSSGIAASQGGEEEKWKGESSALWPDA